jgi:hypothetical protein
VRHTGDSRTIADFHVADDARMSAHDDEVAKFRRSRNAALGHDYEMAPDDVGTLMRIDRRKGKSCQTHEPESTYPSGS